MHAKVHCRCKIVGKEMHSMCKLTVDELGVSLPYCDYHFDIPGALAVPSGACLKEAAAVTISL